MSTGVSKARIEQVLEVIVSEGPMTTLDVRDAVEFSIGHVYRAMIVLEDRGDIYRVSRPLNPQKSDYVFTPDQDPPDEVAMVSYES